jgi:GNAT superfamily N-acetyltransferase
VIRTATHDDLALVQELWRAFTAEIPDAPWREDDVEDDVRELADAIRDGVVLLAGDGDGFVVATLPSERMAFVDVLYVKPEARSRGLAHELIRAAAEQLLSRGAEVVELEVLATNERARALYESWGFSPVELTLASPLQQLVDQLGLDHGGPTFGSVHVQTDDADAVTRSAEKIIPRLGRDRRLSVSPPANGWVQVRAQVADTDPNALARLAQELSYTSGGVSLALGVEEGAVVHYTLYDRGSVVDEYVSVPEFRGPLPPGDVIALGSNPTVVARLTGAEPARVREIARTASSPSELPPWNELYGQIAELMGVEADAHPL